MVTPKGGGDENLVFVRGAGVSLLRFPVLQLCNARGLSLATPYRVLNGHPQLPANVNGVLDDAFNMLIQFSFRVPTRPVLAAAPMATAQHPRPLPPPVRLSACLPVRLTATTRLYPG
jgi:hypothetical protein